MSDGYKTKNVVLNGTSQSVGASATSRVVSNVFPIASQDSLYFACTVKSSGVTSATGITAKLQHSFDGQTWADVGDRAEVSISGNGYNRIDLMATDSSDAAQLPLWPIARVTVTTGSGDAVTVDEVWVTKRV